MTASVVTFGETMALFSPHRTGRLGQSGDFSLGIGGAESNVAIGLARLGVEVVWAGRVGADALGDLVIREIRAEGVGVHATRDIGAPTGLMVKERRTAGASDVLYYRSGSAGSRLSADDLPEREIRDAHVLHISGITLALSETARSAVDRAIDIAIDATTRVSFDINHRSRLWSNSDAAAAAYRAILPRVDILFAGSDEAALVIGGNESGAQQNTEEHLARLLAVMGPSEVLIKRGGKGAVAFVDGAPIQQDAVPIHVVDTVGAGDAFAAGYLSSLIGDEPPKQRLHTAALAGAFACLSHGDWEGLPTLRELDLLDTGRDPVAR